MSDPLYSELYDCQRTMCKITGRELEKGSKNYSRTVFSSLAGVFQPTVTRYDRPRRVSDD